MGISIEIISPAGLALRVNVGKLGMALSVSGSVFQAGNSTVMRKPPYRRHPRLNETGVFRLIVNLRVDLVTCEPKQHHSLLQLLMSITGCNTTLRLARHGHRSVKFTHRRREERRAERGIAGLS